MNPANDRTNVGKFGEEIACQFLIQNKYEILARNHRERFNEIDIIARGTDGVLVFCEVKTLNNNGSGFMPEDNLNPLKYKKMTRAAQIFLARHPGILAGDEEWRMDFIAVDLLEGHALVRHYKNI